MSFWLIGSKATWESRNIRLFCGDSSFITYIRKFVFLSLPLVIFEKKLFVISALVVKYFEGLGCYFFLIDLFPLKGGFNKYGDR